MSRKLIVTLVLILFLLPFISWYYLQRGLDYRKEAQLVMNGNQPFPEGQWYDVKGIKFNSSQLEGRVTLVTVVPCNETKEFSILLDQFYNQFKETQKATFIVLDSCNSFSSLSGKDLSEYYVFSCNDSINPCSSILRLWPNERSHALVDRKMIIRSFYKSQTEDEKRILLEHMALLIPRERSEKVELKRGSQK